MKKIGDEVTLDGGGKCCEAVQACLIGPPVVPGPPPRAFPSWKSHGTFCCGVTCAFPRSFIGVLPCRKLESHHQQGLARRFSQLAFRTLRCNCFPHHWSCLAPGHASSAPSTINTDWVALCQRIRTPDLIGFFIHGNRSDPELI